MKRVLVLLALSFMACHGSNLNTFVQNIHDKLMAKAVAAKGTNKELYFKNCARLFIDKVKELQVADMIKEGDAKFEKNSPLIENIVVGAFEDFGNLPSFSYMIENYDVFNKKYEQEMQQLAALHLKTEELMPEQKLIAQQEMQSFIENTSVDALEILKVSPAVLIEKYFYFFSQLPEDLKKAWYNFFMLLHEDINKSKALIAFIKLVTEINK